MKTVTVHYFTPTGTASRQAGVPDTSEENIRCLVAYVEDVVGIVESVFDGPTQVYRSAVSWSDVYAGR